MPRVTFVKKARKNVPGTSIKKGESYFWWKFRHGGKRTSKERPKASQLTQSEFWGSIYSLLESNENAPDFDEIESGIESIKDELQGISDELQEKISNLESAFPNGCPSLETIQERYDVLESTISDLDGIDVSIEIPDPEDQGEDFDEDQLKSDRAAEIWSEVTDTLGNISCS